MPRRRHRPIFAGRRLPGPPKKGRFIFGLLLAAALALAIFLPSGKYLSRLMGQYGVAYARDTLITGIHDVISEKMAEGGYTYDYFVIIEKDAGGGITALKSDMAHINALSSALIRDIVTAAADGDFDVRIPFGNLTGVGVLSGRGPGLPLKIVMLTSSSAEFKNNFSAAGINQTKHQIMLHVDMDVDILVPWDSVRTTVSTDILIAETVVVGRVPDTYLEFGK